MDVALVDADAVLVDADTVLVDADTVLVDADTVLFDEDAVLVDAAVLVLALVELDDGTKAAKSIAHSADPPKFSALYVVARLALVASLRYAAHDPFPYVIRSESLVASCHAVTAVPAVSSSACAMYPDAPVHGPGSLPRDVYRHMAPVQPASAMRKLRA